MTTTPHYDRIRALVILLEHIPREQQRGRLPKMEFNMEGTWYREGCRTEACALSHAASHEVFQRHGLRLKKFDSGVVMPVFGDYAGLKAGSEFFGLTDYTAQHWFDSHQYLIPFHNITPQDVADRIRSFLKYFGELGKLGVEA